MTFARILFLITSALFVSPLFALDSADLRNYRFVSQEDRLNYFWFRPMEHKASFKDFLHEIQRLSVEPLLGPKFLMRIPSIRGGFLQNSYLGIRNEAMVVEIFPQAQYRFSVWVRRDMPLKNHAHSGIERVVGEIELTAVENYVFACVGETCDGRIIRKNSALGSWEEMRALTVAEIEDFKLTMQKLLWPRE